MTVPAPDAEMAKIMEDSSLSAVERMRLKQNLMNERFLAAAAQDEEDEPDCKVRTARTCDIPLGASCISLLGKLLGCTCDHVAIPGGASPSALSSAASVQSPSRVLALSYWFHVNGCVILYLRCRRVRKTWST